VSSAAAAGDASSSNGDISLVEMGQPSMVLLHSTLPSKQKRKNTVVLSRIGKKKKGNVKNLIHQRTQNALPQQPSKLLAAVSKRMN